MQTNSENALNTIDSKNPNLNVNSNKKDNKKKTVITQETQEEEKRLKTEEELEKKNFFGKFRK